MKGNDLMSNLFFLLALVCLVTLIVGMVKPELVIRWGNKRNRKMVFRWYGVGLIASFILMGATAENATNKNDAASKSTSTSTQKEEVKKEAKKEESPKEEPKKVETLADLVAKNLKDGKVTSEGKVLTIEFKGSDFSENMFVEGGLNDIRKCFKDIYKNDQFKKFDTVNVKVMCELTDQYGKKSSSLGMSLTFAQSELQKVENFDNITIDQLVLLQGEVRTGLTGAIRKGLSQKNIKMLYPNQ